VKGVFGVANICLLGLLVEQDAIGVWGGSKDDALCLERLRGDSDEHASGELR